MVRRQNGLPLGSILGPLSFLIYINDLSDDLVSSVKHFAGDTSLFSVVRNSSISANELNNDLQIIIEWAHKGMEFTFQERHIKLWYTGRQS